MGTASSTDLRHRPGLGSLRGAAPPTRRLVGGGGAIEEWYAEQSMSQISDESDGSDGLGVGTMRLSQRDMEGQHDELSQPVGGVQESGNVCCPMRLSECAVVERAADLHAEATDAREMCAWYEEQAWRAHSSQR